MSLSGGRATAPPPHTVIRTPRSTLSFYLADCLDVLTSLSPARASVIVTSPPYNLGVRYRTYDDTVPREDYLAWTDAWIGAAAGALDAQGSLFLNLGAKPTDPWTAMDIAQTARRHLVLQNTLHWIKSIAIEKDAAGAGAGLARDLAVGHYKPINSPRFVNDCHEFIFHFTPAGRTRLDRGAVGVPYQDASNITRWRSAGGNRRCRGNTWFIPYETIQSRDRERPHPATFPAKLAEYCLRLHGVDRVRLVIDPFLGLGSSAVAAAKLGVDFIGIEVDEQYLVEAIRRVQEEIGDAGRRRPARPGARSRAAKGRAASKLF
jgi:site-specific DNA-methyltransferase (adenine-specific)